MVLLSRLEFCILLHFSEVHFGSLKRRRGILFYAFYSGSLEIGQRPTFDFECTYKNVRSLSSLGLGLHGKGAARNASGLNGLLGTGKSRRNDPHSLIPFLD